MRYLKKQKGFWILFATLAILIGCYFARSQFQSVHYSPHRVYKLEFHRPSLWQRMAHIDFRDPAFIRLYRVEPKSLLGESPVVDLEGGAEIMWLIDEPHALGKVWAGQDAVFHNIPPECDSASTISTCPKGE